MTIFIEIMRFHGNQSIRNRMKTVAISKPHRSHSFAHFDLIFNSSWLTNLPTLSDSKITFQPKNLSFEANGDYSNSSRLCHIVHISIFWYDIVYKPCLSMNMNMNMNFWCANVCETELNRFLFFFFALSLVLNFAFIFSFVKFKPFIYMMYPNQRIWGVCQFYCIQSHSFCITHHLASSKRKQNQPHGRWNIRSSCLKRGQHILWTFNIVHLIDVWNDLWFPIAMKCTNAKAAKNIEHIFTSRFGLPSHTQFRALQEK